MPNIKRSYNLVWEYCFYLVFEEVYDDCYPALMDDFGNAIPMDNYGLSLYSLS